MATPLQYPSRRIPWTEEPGRLQFIGSQRVGHKWSTHAHTHPVIPHHKGKMQVEGIRALLQLLQWLLIHTTSSASHLLSVYHVPGTIKSTFQVLNYGNSFCLSNHTGLITHGTIIDPTGLFLFLIKSMLWQFWRKWKSGYHASTQIIS